MGGGGGKGGAPRSFPFIFSSSSFLFRRYCATLQIPEINRISSSSSSSSFEGGPFISGRAVQHKKRNCAQKGENPLLRARAYLCRRRRSLFSYSGRFGVEAISRRRGDFFFPPFLSFPSQYRRGTPMTQKEEKENIKYACFVIRTRVQFQEYFFASREKQEQTLYYDLRRGTTLF